MVEEQKVVIFRAWPNNDTKAKVARVKVFGTHFCTKASTDTSQFISWSLSVQDTDTEEGGDDSKDKNVISSKTPIVIPFSVFSSDVPGISISTTHAYNEKAFKGLDNIFDMHSPEFSYEPDIFSFRCDFLTVIACELARHYYNTSGKDERMLSTFSSCVEHYTKMFENKRHNIQNVICKAFEHAAEFESTNNFEGMVQQAKRTLSLAGLSFLVALSLDTEHSQHTMYAPILSSDVRRKNMYTAFQKISTFCHDNEEDAVNMLVCFSMLGTRCIEDALDLVDGTHLTTCCVTKAVISPFSINMCHVVPCHKCKLLYCRGYTCNCSSSFLTSTFTAIQWLHKAWSEKQQQEKTISKLKKDILSSSKQNELLCKKSVEQKKEIIRIQGDFKTQKETQKDEMANALSMNKREKQDMKLRFSEEKRQIQSSFNAKLASLCEENKLLQMQLDNQSEQVVEKQELSTAKQELSTAKQELSTAKQELSTANQESSAAKRQLSTVKQEVSTAKRELSTAKQELSRTKQELSTAKQISNKVKKELNSELVSTKILNTKLQNELASYKFSEKQATQQLQRLRAETIVLRTEMSQLETKPMRSVSTWTPKMKTSEACTFTTGADKTTCNAQPNVDILSARLHKLEEFMLRKDDIPEEKNYMEIQQVQRVSVSMQQQQMNNEIQHNYQQNMQHNYQQNMQHNYQQNMHNYYQHQHMQHQFPVEMHHMQPDMNFNHMQDAYLPTHDPSAYSS